MSSAQENSVYKVIEIVGVSSESWEAATKAAVERASKTLRDLRVAEVVKLDVAIEDGKVCLPGRLFHKEGESIISRALANTTVCGNVPAGTFRTQHRPSTMTREDPSLKSASKLCPGARSVPAGTFSAKASRSQYASLPLGIDAVVMAPAWGWLIPKCSCRNIRPQMTNAVTKRRLPLPRQGCHRLALR